MAARQRAEVCVWFYAQPIECARGVTTVEDLGFDVDPVYVHMLEASPELECGLRVHLENQRRLPVTVRGVELPNPHGPGTMNGIRAGELSPFRVSPQTADATGPPAVDAVYPFDHQLEPRQGFELRIALEHQPEGCMSPGSTAWVTDAPAVEVSFLALRGMRTPTGVVFSQRGTDASSCGFP